MLTTVDYRGWPESYSLSVSIVLKFCPFGWIPCLIQSQRCLKAKCKKDLLIQFLLKVLHKAGVLSFVMDMINLWSHWISQSE